MTSHTSSRRHLRNAALAVAAIALVAGISLAVRREESAPPAAAEIFKTATVEEGSLGITEQLDGSLLLSDVTSVLHRIEGQTSSMLDSAGDSPTGSTPPAAGGIASLSAVRTDAVAPITCDESGPPPDSTTTTTEPVPDTTTPTTGTVPDTSTSTPDTSSPTTTEPATSTTTPCPTVTTIGGGGPNGGGAPTGGVPTGGVPTGGVPTGGGGTTGGGTTTSTERVTQLVTSIIGTGSPVALGTILYSVESSPVVALAGSQPAWRTLSTDSDDGIDIMQLEMSLVALGYDPAATMTVDTTFDDDTEAVVEAWQAGYGMEVTGEVPLGSVVFVGAATTVTEVTAAVGDSVSDGDEVLALSATSQQVVIDVPEGDEASLVPGLGVRLGSSDGTVTLLRSIDRDGAVVVQAVITPDAPIENATNGQAITVTVTLTSLDSVLTVPTEALVSRIDGSYALQVVLDDGSSSFLAVDVLGVAGSVAAVRGDGLAAGATVLQPV